MDTAFFPSDGKNNGDFGAVGEHIKRKPTVKNRGCFPHIHCSSNVRNADFAAVCTLCVLALRESFSDRKLEMSTPLGRLVIYTKKIDAMTDFYCKHFGFKELRNEGDRIIELQPQGTGISLLLHPASKRQKEGQPLVKLVFDVQDVFAFCKTAEAKGLIFGKVYQADGYAFANAKDPSSNSIQVSRADLI